MKVPKKIKILGQDYNVIEKEDAKMEGIMGLCLSDDCEIHLRKSMPEDKKGEVFLHEVVHAIAETLNLKLTENQVNNLGVGLYGFLASNKITWQKKTNTQRV